ncbi:MAG TPA: pilus assembly protein N-terminal domain-containing protein [Bryobacteraceae bacterium]|jgi:pilus assembly protein CpaC
MIRNTHLFVKRGALCGAVWALLVVNLPAQNAEDLRLTVNKSVVIEYPSDVAKIDTSNPEVVDVVLSTTREVLVNAKGVGNATLIIWNRANQRTMYNVNVELNLDPLRQLLKQSFPNEPIQAFSSRDNITLTGVVSNKEVADRAGLLASSFSKTVLNNLTLPVPPPEKQILLRVKFIELDRDKEVQYGVNLLAAPGGNAIGSTTGQFSSSSLTGTLTIPSSAAGSTTSSTGGTAAASGSTSTAGTTSSSIGNSALVTITQALNLFALDPKLNLGAFIKALQNENILEILAEPNLVTTNGKEAQFLVGGQFPVPIVQGGATSGAVTVQFKDYGIKLIFTPNITANGNISIHLKQEVSTLDPSNAVVLNGFTIQALATRTTESTVELGDGQSFVVSGLISNQEQYALSKVPWISSIPILGNLFKSKDEKVSRTDLIMTVTPEITMPLGPKDPQPDIYMPKDFLKKLEAKDIPPQPVNAKKK